MLCYVMLCYVMSIMLCYVHYVILCPLCYVMLCYVMTIMLCYVHYVILCPLFFTQMSLSGFVELFLSICYTLFVEIKEANLCDIRSSIAKTFVQILYTPLKN